jgi:Leucine-rich repeat (LRR) protein
MKTKLFLFFTFLSLAINAQVSQAERQALIDFYNATDGDNWTNNTNWDTDPNATSNVNTWFGVTTAIRDGLEHVYWVSLNNNNINGEITDFKSLEKLNKLELGANSISGILDISKLPIALEILQLFTNNLSGEIPNLSTINNLKTLTLNRNKFSGIISKDFFSETITTLLLGDNNISGELDFSSFNNLTLLSLGETNINFLKIPASVIGSNNRLQVKNMPNLAYIEVPNVSDFLNLSENNFDLGLRIVGYDQADQTATPNTVEREALKKLYENKSYTYASTIKSDVNDTEWLKIVVINGETRVTEIHTTSLAINGPMPTEIGVFTELKHLHIPSSGMNTIATELKNATKLEELYLNNNGITTIPTDFYDLVKLRILNINNNQIPSIASGLGDFTDLEELYFSNTQVDLIPTTIGNLKKLEILEFANTKISLLPPQIGGLIELRRLVAAPNNIASIPSEFGQLTKLQFLDFANCELSNTPAAFANLTELETLFLNDNELQVVAGLGGFTKLKFLRLHNNRLGEDNPNFNTDLPEDMSYLVDLEELTLYNNKLTKLPADIGNLSKLTSLRLEGNRLAIIPSSIGELVNLEELDVSSNNLESIPVSIGDLVKLKNLQLSGNELISLPEELGSLSNLETFELNSQSKIEDNKSIRTLISLPSTMKNLSKLTSFSAQNNKITGLVDLSGINTLSTIYLQNNEITDLKLGVLPSGLSSVRYNITQNPFITCVEVPTNQITNWEQPLSRDNGVAISDNCTGFRVPQIEREALIALYNSTGGGTDWIGLNWETDPTRLTNVGSWGGVVTGLVDGQKHVVELILTGFNQPQFRLRGEIPSEIKNLPELRTINLSYDYQVDNKITKIAKEIGELTKLTYLNFQRNALTTVPSEIGDLPLLEELNLQENQITSLPPGIGNFKKLKKLDLRNQNRDADGNNNLISLPDEIVNITTLELLDLSANGLTTLPSSIGELVNLEELDVSSNNLESLPTSINNLFSLKKLSLNNNLISGDLDLSNLEVITDLSLQYNNISELKIGVAPTIFGTSNNPDANRLHLNRNALGCIEVPTDELVAWQLSVYNEEGNIIDNGVVYSDNCSAVTTNSIPDLEREALIAIYNSTKGADWQNDLSGSYNGVTWVNDATQKRNIGAWFGVTTAMINGQKHVTKVALNSNLLDGTIPSVIKNLTQLKELEFNSNAVSEIPKEIGELTNLEQLTFTSQYNATQAEYVLKIIPAEINNLSSLKRLELSSNQLEGNLDFSNLRNLRNLSVSGNQITGLKIGISPGVFDSANQDGYSNSFSFSSNQYLYCIAVPQNLISAWEASSFATSNANIVWGQDCSSYNNVPENEIQALVDLYNNLDGANWTNNTNWNGDLAKALINNPYNATKWQGVATKIVDAGKHITDITLSSNKLKGELPQSIGNLTKLTNFQISSNEVSGNLPATFGNLTALETLYLNSNKITGLPNEMSNLIGLTTAYFQNNEVSGKLPDFTGADNLTRLDINNNKFQFGDFEDEFNTYQNLQTFSYTSQAKVGDEETVDFGDGFTKTLEAMVSGANNTYQWYKNGGAIADATSSSYSITDATSADAGYYFCRVTNSVVTGLTIETERVTLTFDAALSMEDEVFSNVIRLYPNPVTNVLQIRNDSDTIINKIEIYNLLGKKIATHINPGNSVDVAQLAKGIYIVNVFSDKAKMTRRILKE